MSRGSDCRNDFTPCGSRLFLDAYNAPSFTYKYGTLHAFPDPQARRDYVIDFFEVNRKQGPATWEIVAFAVTGLGRNSALVAARWVFRPPDGSSVLVFVDSYHLCRFDGCWKIFVRRLHD